MPYVTPQPPGEIHFEWLIVLGEGQPDTVVYDDPGPYPGDTGYVVVMEGHADDDEDDGHMACAACTVDIWPDLQYGMALAREHGAATLDPESGESVAGEEED